MAGADRHLHASGLHSAGAPGRLRRLVLPVSRLAVRHVGPHPPGARTGQSTAAALRVPRRHQDPHRVNRAAVRNSTMNENSIHRPDEHAIYQPSNRFLNWLEVRLPVLNLVYSSFVVYPTPRNLNYWWTFGGILTFLLGAQIVTGVVLAMHYTPHVDHAFNSVEHIMRDVNWGWLLRYAHATGASMFFLAAYIHMFRGLYYGSYKDPREVLWILGVIILLLMIMAGFMGYVLPWGQMSFWAATVITNLFSAIQ